MSKLSKDTVPKISHTHIYLRNLRLIGAKILVGGRIVEVTVTIVPFIV